MTEATRLKKDELVHLFHGEKRVTETHVIEILRYNELVVSLRVCIPPNSDDTGGI